MWTFLKEIHTLGMPYGFENRGEPAGFSGSPFLASLNKCVFPGDQRVASSLHDQSHSTRIKKFH